MATKKKLTRTKPAKKKAAKKKAAKKKPAKKQATQKQAAKGKPIKQAAKGKPIKQAAKKQTRQEQAAQKKPAKKAAPARQPFKRRDATGHLDPSYARDLRRSSLENVEHDDDRGFLVGKTTEDALAQELGREFVETVTSGEDGGTELRDEFVTEEVGGPFVTTTRGQEIDEQPDESNPKGSTREPFPKT